MLFCKNRKDGESDGLPCSRYIFAACGIVVFLSFLLFLPPLQELAIFLGEHLKGRGLNHEHWKTAFRSLASSLILFSVIICACCCFINRSGGIKGAVADINSKKMKGVYLGLFFFALTLLGTGAYITDGHDWGGDFSEYIMQGISIAEGSYSTSYVVEPRFFVYPHGFPLLLSLVYKFFGFTLLAFKMVNVILYASFVFVLFLFCDRELKRTTSCVIAFLFAFSPCLYKLVDCILSDISSMFFSIAGVYYISLFFKEASGRRKLFYSCAIAFFSFCAYICRDSGIVVLCTFAAAQLLLCVMGFVGGRKNRFDFSSILASIIPYLLFFALSFLVNDVLYASPARQQMGMFKSLSLRSIISNCSYYFFLISDFFYPHFLWFAVFPAILWAMIHFFQKDYVLIIYFWGTIALYILWPIGGQGIRYVASALPVLLFFCGRAVELLYESKDSRPGLPLFVFSRHSYLLLAVLFCISSLAICVVSGVRNIVSGRYLSSGSYTREAVEMYSYINEKLSDDEVIFFFKPRVLLMTTGNACVYTDPSRPVDASSFDYYLHTFDHGYGQLLSDEQAREASFSLGGQEFVCVHENEKMKLFGRVASQ